MHIKYILPLLTLFMPTLKAIDLGNAMTPQEKKDTGYSSLSPKQQKNLNAWLSKHGNFHSNALGSSKLSLNINTQNGKQLILSDGSKWEVAPADRGVSSIWLTPIPMSIEPNTSPDYPYTLINQDSINEKVKAKPVSK